jgi:cardiolipin synthase A/B
MQLRAVNQSQVLKFGQTKPANLAASQAGPVKDFLSLGGRQNPALISKLQALKASLPPVASAMTPAQLEQMVGQALNDPEVEKQLISQIALLNASGQLKPLLHQVADQAMASGTLPSMPEAKKDEMIEQFAGMVDAGLSDHGLNPACAGPSFSDWKSFSEKNLAAVRQSQTAPRGPGELSRLTEPSFIAELEALQGAKFSSGNRITPLVDGPASFAERKTRIENATQSVHVMSWAFYDDETGWEMANLLAKKKAEGLDVKVVVDGQVAAKEHHHGTLDFMAEQGVEVVRWTDADRKYDGSHRKVTVIDGKVAIAGGMNVGNVYSHQGPADGQKWRDTDVLIEGPAVKDCQLLFNQTFGQECAVSDVAPVGSAKTAVVNHHPGPEGDANVHLAILKAIEGASESIDIENAYFITTPDLSECLSAALARGVKVRILTNSAKSVDEPVVSTPIQKSLPDLLAKGAEIYLKQGDTLHSKFMVVDGVYSSVGSHNLHPRSQRYEGEMTVNSLDVCTAQAMTGAFENDIQKAERIVSKDQIHYAENLLTTLAERYFFDQL